MKDVTQALLDLLHQSARGALATVVRASGSTPQQPGARLLLRPDQSTVGTVGGGAVEQAVLVELRRTLGAGKARVVAYDLSHLGMCCGGQMEVFVEPVSGHQRLFIVGAGHVARALAPLAQSVGFALTIVDEREELNNEERFPRCKRLVTDPRGAARVLEPTERDWVLIATHDHGLDEAALSVFGNAPHRYVGLMGSRRKVIRIFQRLYARDALPPLERVYAPVGLSIGAVTPAELAVSVVAELIAVDKGQSTHHLRTLVDSKLERVLEGDAPIETALDTEENE